MGSKTLRSPLPGAFFTDAALAEMECLGKERWQQRQRVLKCCDTFGSFVSHILSRRWAYEAEDFSIEFHSAYLRMHWMEVMQKVISLGAVLTCKGIGLVCLVLCEV